jgi:hypothetical protein
MSNWSKLDYFLPLCLVKEENALLDLKGGIVAVNNGAAKINEGFEFFGAEWLDTNWTPSLDGQILDNAQVEVFVMETHKQAGTIGSYIGGANGNNPRNTVLTRNDTTGEVNFGMGNMGGVGAYVMPDKTLASAHTNSEAITVQGYIDGVKLGNTTSATQVSLLSNRIYVGAYNRDEVLFWASISKIAFATMGKSLGVDQVAKNDNYRQFLEDLGINLSPEENKLAGATITDTLQGATVSDELKGL